MRFAWDVCWHGEPVTDTVAPALGEDLMVAPSQRDEPGKLRPRETQIRDMACPVHGIGHAETVGIVVIDPVARVVQQPDRFVGIAANVHVMGQREIGETHFARHTVEQVGKLAIGGDLGETIEISLCTIEGQHSAACAQDRIGALKPPAPISSPSHPSGSVLKRSEWRSAVARILAVNCSLPTARLLCRAIFSDYCLGHIAPLERSSGTCRAGCEYGLRVSRLRLVNETRWRRRNHAIRTAPVEISACGLPSLPRRCRSRSVRNRPCRQRRHP